jgi:hypothetical protein
MPGRVKLLNPPRSFAHPPHPVHGWVAVARRFCTNVQGRSQVTRGWNAGYALATPWPRPDNQATLEQHPVHHGANPGHATIKHKLRPEYTRPLLGNTWETPGAHPGYTRKPGGSAGSHRSYTGVVPREKHQATRQVTPRGHPSDTQMAPVKPGLHQGHSGAASKLRQVTPG